MLNCFFITIFVFLGIPEIDSKVIANKIANTLLLIFDQLIKYFKKLELFTKFKSIANDEILINMYKIV